MIGRVTSLLTALLLLVATPLVAQSVVAHRGHHSAEGATENSLAALHAAQNAGIAIVEIDVIITKDMEMVVAHGPRHSYDGRSVSIGNCDLATLRSMPLENGEVIPTLDDYLREVKSMPNIELFVEMKVTGGDIDQERYFEMVDTKIEEYGIAERTTYISFSRELCHLAAAHNKRVLYLGSDMSPRKAAKLNYTGINYSIKIMRLHPRWIRKAHDMAMEVGVWTANSANDIEWAIRHNVDYITTDNPLLVVELLTR